MSYNPLATIGYVAKNGILASQTFLAYLRGIESAAAPSTIADLPDRLTPGSMRYILDTSKPAWLDASGVWRYADGTTV